DGLDGREPFRTGAHGRVWIRAVDGSDRLFYPAARHHRPARAWLPARGGDWERPQRQALAARLSGRHSPGVRESVDGRRPVCVRRPHVARPRPPHRAPVGEAPGALSHEWTTLLRLAHSRSAPSSKLTRRTAAEFPARISLQSPPRAGCPAVA